MRRRSFDSGEIKRAADGGASIYCCCNYNAILAQSQMKLFGTEPAMDACVIAVVKQSDMYVCTVSVLRVCMFGCPPGIYNTINYLRYPLYAID